MQMPYRIGIIGLGKIARDQHVPSIQANPAFELVAASSQRSIGLEGVPHAFSDYRDMLKMPELDAVAICTPPQVRHAIARDALLAGKHALLEKPPAATLSELVDLEMVAARQGRVLFTTWHAQYNAGVAEAQRRLAGHTVRKLLVTWKEDVRRWHPGETWIWQAGGFGVFDPGINALAIVTRILPTPIFVQKADLEFPSNLDAPIAASLVFSTGAADEDLRAEFDWRHTGPQTWDIEIGTRDGGTIALRRGGSRLEINGEAVVDEPSAEYAGIYARFAELLSAGQSEVDAAPLRLAADAFLRARRVTIEAFSP
jgi:D-galactose 1-dehydrogenase